MRRIRRHVLLLIDLGLIALATLLALALRDNLEVSAAKLNAILPYLAITLATATAVLIASGVHRTIWRFSALTDYLRVLASVIVIVSVAVALGFLVNRHEGVARALPVIQGLLMAFLLVGVRVAMRMRHTARDQQGPAPSAPGARETVLVVGLNTLTELFLRSVAEFAPERIKIAGIVGRTERHSGRSLRQHQILGMPEEIETIVRTLEVHGMSVDRIVVTMAFADLSPAAQQALLGIERTSDIRLDFFAERIGLIERSDKRPEPTQAEHDDGEAVAFSVPELEAAAQRLYLRVKRAGDIAGAALLLILILPLIVAVGLVVAFDVGLPTVFWQQRPGMRGLPFKLYKFRTMRNAHDRDGARIPDEQRLSSIGRLLRRTRLDELPQLYNILMGEMSFVGPRPLLPTDQASAFTARLLVPPGLTGWAQVNGGRAITAHDKAALDVWYVRNASLRLDIAILARTVSMIVHGERATTEAMRQAWEELAGSRFLAAGSVAAGAVGAQGPSADRRRRWEHVR